MCTRACVRASVTQQDILDIISASECNTTGHFGYYQPFIAQLGRDQ